MNKTHILKVDSLTTPIDQIKGGLIAWGVDGKIIYSGPAGAFPHSDGTAIDLPELCAVPGFVDVHTHGGWGVAFGMGDLEEGLRQYSARVVTSGVTGFLITVSGPNPKEIIKIITSYVPFLEKEFPGAVPLGFHLEGPFLNPDRRGAFNPGWLHHPTIHEIKEYETAAQGYLRQVSLAPELENAFAAAEYLEKKNIRAALAHSNADFDTAARALAGSFTHVTHAFNTQSPFHHREPGVVGAVLTSDHATAELIVDGVHVHPGAMRLLIRCLGEERVVLITDAMPGAGLDDGEYDLMNQKVTVKNGKAYLADGTIAGSAATMDACFDQIINEAGVTLQQASRMASLNPARVIGMENRLGSLQPGHEADITLFDEEGKVQAVFVRGKLRYKAM